MGCEFRTRPGQGSDRVRPGDAARGMAVHRGPGRPGQRRRPHPGNLPAGLPGAHRFRRSLVRAHLAAGHRQACLRRSHPDLAAPPPARRPPSRTFTGTGRRRLRRRAGPVAWAARRAARGVRADPAGRPLLRGGGPLVRGTGGHHPLPGRARPHTARRRGARGGFAVAMRWFLAVLCGVLGALAMASPASAHAADAPVASDYRCVVTAITTPLPGLTIRAVTAGTQLELVNRTGRTIEVLGYSGEPYLRVAPDGVYQNANSPATYLNQSATGGPAPPASPSPAPPPAAAEPSRAPAL